MTDTPTISLCIMCNCMTKTINNHCGKCGERKQVDTPYSDEIDEILRENREDRKRALCLLEMGNVNVGDAEKLEKLADLRAKQRLSRLLIDAKNEELKKFDVRLVTNWEDEAVGYMTERIAELEQQRKELS